MAKIVKGNKVAAHFLPAAEGSEAVRIPAVLAASSLECGGDDLAVIEQLSARDFEPWAAAGEAGTLFVTGADDVTVETAGELLCYAEHAAYRTASRRLYLFGPACEASRRSARELAARWIADHLARAATEDLIRELDEATERAKAALDRPRYIPFDVAAFEAANPWAGNIPVPRPETVGAAG